MKSVVVDCMLNIKSEILWEVIYMYEVNSNTTAVTGTTGRSLHYASYTAVPCVEIPVEVCRPDVGLPQYANPWDSGMDVRAAEDIIIHPDETKIVPTGLKVAIPEGYEIQVRPRSGLSLKTKLRVANSPGTVDSAYKEEIGIIMTNTSFTHSSTDAVDISEIKNNEEEIYLIPKGTRIAQLVLAKVPRIQWELVESVKDIGFTRTPGFGSSGLK